MRKLISKWFKQLHITIFLLTFLGIGYGIYHNIQSCVYHQRWVLHTYDVMVQINEAQAKLYDLDAVFMRYSVLKEERYLELYKVYLLETNASSDKLKELTSDNQAQQDNWEILNKAILDRRTLRNSVIGADFPLLHKAVTSHENNNLRINISGRFKIMMDEEKRLLEIRTSEYYHSIIMLSGLVCFGAILLAAAFGFISGQFHTHKTILSDFIKGI